MKKKIINLSIVLMLVFSLTACNINATADKNTSVIKTQQSKQDENKLVQNEKLKIHFIDVGQADCTLIELPNGEEALIDTGNEDDASDIISYIESLNIDDLEYMILTHPHEDHIGAAKEIIENFDIEKVYMPDVSAESKLYKDMISAIEKRSIPIIKTKSGLNLIKTQDITFDVLAPKSMYYSEMNEYSIVTKLTYMDESFLFAGDAESVSELEMIRGGYDLDCDLLKIGHHGGRTSSSSNFLKSATPEYGVISCGKNNMYSHPHIETLERLTSIGSKIYRTDELGTIIVASDGKNLSIKNKDNSVIETSANATTEQTQYVGNKNSSVFHKPDCNSLSEMKNSNKVFFSERQDAVNKGYKPCSRCNP